MDKLPRASSLTIIFFWLRNFERTLIFDQFVFIVLAQHNQTFTHSTYCLTQAHKSQDVAASVGGILKLDIFLSHRVTELWLCTVWFIKR